MKNVMVKWLALFMCLSMSFGHVSVVSASVYGKAGGPAAVTEEEKDVTWSADEADAEAPADAYAEEAMVGAEVETEESSSGETLEAKADGGEIPVEEADAGETSAGESTMEEMPAEEADLEETPAEESAMEEMPAEEADAEETSAEESAMEEMPEEETEDAEPEMSGVDASEDTGISEEDAAEEEAADPGMSEEDISGDSEDTEEAISGDSGAAGEEGSEEEQSEDMSEQDVETPVSDGLTEDMEETGNEAAPEAAAAAESAETRQYENEVIVGFEDLGDAAVIDLEQKLALVGLQKLLPEKLGIQFGGTVYYEIREDGTLAPVRAEGYNTQSVDVSWQCVENYDDSLESFHFVPVLDDYTLAEGLELPEITVIVRGTLQIPPLKEKEETPYDQHEVPQIGAVTKNGKPVRRGTYPAKYDAFASGKLPAIRNQDPYGTCWAHGTIGSIETDLIADGNAGTGIDLSELHLAYFMNHSYFDEKDCNTGDSIDPAYDYLDEGGDERTACNILANMVGPVQESSVPYSWGESYSPGSYDGRGLNTAQLTGVYEINTSDRDAVKNAIMTHGAVDAAFYVADYYDDYYSYTNNSYYYPEFNYMNHAVMLVGWDDNFSSSRFIGGTPEGNGAWLVRNSWGLSDYGFSGYFWISYYDKSLYDTVLAMDAQTSRYDHCYAYDSIPFYTYDEYTSDTGHYSGTQYFYVEGNEQIKAVGIQAQDPMMDVEISLLCGNSSSTTTTSIGYPGYYLIPVDKALGVRQGSTVKVTVTFSRDGVIHFPVEESYSYAGSDFEAYCGSGGVTLDDGSGNTINTEADGGIKLFTMDYTPSQDPWDSAGSLYSGSNNVPVSSGQTVYYAFTPQNTGDYELFSMSGKDTYACLYNDNKELLTNNDDGGEGNNFKITYSLIEDTTYYLGIKYYNSSESGDIPVGIAFLPQENLNVVGVSAGGTEYIAFTPSADGNYSFSACSGMDTCGTLYDSNWNQLAWDDDGGYERDFIITCSLEAYSTYYLGVNYFSSSDFGSMAVIMAKSAITGTNLVTVSGGSGAYLAFTPQTTGNYEIYSDSDLDPYVDMYDLGFMTLARDDDGGSDNNFRLVTTLEAGTTYLFEIRLYGGTAYADVPVVIRKYRESISGATVTISSPTYTGSALTPKPTVKLNNKTLVKGTDYTVKYSNNIKAGTATVTITGTGNYKGTKSVNFTIKRASISKATVSLPASKVWAGYALTPVPTVKLGSKTLKKGTDFSLSFTNNKNVGLAAVTITGKGNYNSSYKKYFRIIPKPTTISSISRGSRKLTVKWKKQASQTTGYQIQYSSKSNFSTQKIVEVSGVSKTSKTITSLAKKRKYYVRIRTYKIVNGTKYYSTWSTVKTATTK